MHLNELRESYESKGLSILALTSEGVGDTEKWVKDKGVTYPYAYDKGGKLSNWFGVSGIPHAVLLDSNGTVVWKGHPASLPTETLEAALSTALTVPLYDWSGAAKAARAFLQKGQYAKALAAAQKLKPEDEGPAISAAIERMVESKVASLEALLQAGDYLAVELKGKTLQAGLEGLPQFERAKATLAKLAAEPKAAAVIKAQKDLLELKTIEVEKKKDADRLIKGLKAILADVPGSLPARQAQSLLDEVEALRPGLK